MAEEEEHEWRLVAEETEERALVRLFVCSRCGAVRYE
jgi:formylmethanofuran dehydrogenase subunit E